jgi:hypothetical protein
MPLAGSQQRGRSDVAIVIGTWAVLAVGLTAIASQNLFKPGLYYDEAVFAGLAKDFIAGHQRLHMPGTETLQIFHRPFPLFVQCYLGALKSWLLMPGLALFGFKLAAVRLTHWCWGLLTVLLFMLGIRRWLGLRVALVAGITLACDPTVFFLNVFDWGAAISSLLCRCAALYLTMIWWQKRRPIFLWAASFFLGLGLFNKFDFTAFLLGIGMAALIFYPSALWKFLRYHLWAAAGCGIGFLLGAGPIILKVPSIVKVTTLGLNADENEQKVNTFVALYDGSYFPRLMNDGGLFTQMYLRPAPAYSLFGFVFVAAMVVLIAIAISNGKKAKRQFARFILTGFVLTAIGVFLIPGAVRIHHAVLAFPFPQIIIATAAIFLWEQQWRSARAIRGLVFGVLVILVASQLFVIQKTEGIVRKTGGRGWWSDAFDKFCQENKDRADLTIISLDWGFNEQVSFLTEIPQMVEPIWAFQQYKQGLPPLPIKPDYIYLVHAPDYSLMRYDTAYLEDARNSSRLAKIQPYFDAEGHTVFYTIQFPE